MAAEPLGWSCVAKCGACCFLAPQDRPYLEDLLTREELTTFRGLVGADGWCRHYDQESRGCGIYDERPSFCRVKEWLIPKAAGFGLDVTDGAATGTFCASCCREHVSDVYGQESQEMVRFNDVVGADFGYDTPDEALEALAEAAGSQEPRAQESMEDGWRVAGDIDGYEAAGEDGLPEDFDDGEDDAEADFDDTTTWEGLEEEQESSWEELEQEEQSGGWEQFGDAEEAKKAEDKTEP